LKAESDMQPIEEELKVLVVDNSPVLRNLVEWALSQKRYSFLFAETGQEALDLFEEHRPPLVIMGWTLPDLTGEKLCRCMRTRSQDSYTYILVLTCETEKSDLIFALNAGADDYLTKPFHRGELVARVGVGLRIVELQRRIESKNVVLEELALSDSLTGLPNRRAIENWASSQLSGALRHGYSFWVVLADLDHFKQVNDTFGHEAGDNVLKKFSEILKSCMRGSDLCARLGGEEFLLILTHSNKDSALAVTERIRTKLADTPFNFGPSTVTVTASFGLAGFEGTQEPSTFSKLQELADAALYSAKRAGRNRVEITAGPAC